MNLLLHNTLPKDKTKTTSEEAGDDAAGNDDKFPSKPTKKKLCDHLAGALDVIRVEVEAGGLVCDQRLNRKLHRLLSKAVKQAGLESFESATQQLEEDSVESPELQTSFFPSVAATAPMTP